MPRDAKQHVSLRLDPELLARIDAKVTREDSSRTQVITEAVGAYMFPPVAEIVLCVQSHQPIDPGNYVGLTRCLGRQTHHGNCIFAGFTRIPGSVHTAEERMEATERGTDHG